MMALKMMMLMAMLMMMIMMVMTKMNLVMMAIMHIMLKMRAMMILLMSLAQIHLYFQLFKRLAAIVHEVYQKHLLSKPPHQLRKEDSSGGKLTGG